MIGWVFIVKIISFCKRHINKANVIAVKYRLLRLLGKCVQMKMHYVQSVALQCQYNKDRQYQYTMLNFFT